MDGVGTLVLCTLGVATYYAWFDKAPAPYTIVSGITVHPGDSFFAGVTTTGYFLSDITSLSSVSAAWIVPTQNWGECVVMRGTDIGLPTLFHPVPAFIPTALTSPVSFSTCAYLDSQTSSTNGIGMLPLGFTGYIFDMKNPTVVKSIKPTATFAPFYDSFIVP